MTPTAEVRQPSNVTLECRVLVRSTGTLLCTYLSAILLVGLVLNGLWGWSWADPAAALGIAAIAVREGANAWRGDPCC